VYYVHLQAAKHPRNLILALFRLNYRHLSQLSLFLTLIVKGQETMSQAVNERHSEILEIVEREHRYALSDREWKHRLRGYGYSIKESDEGRFLTSLLRGEQVCALPAHLAA
jgi:hypothetical protein